MEMKTIKGKVEFICVPIEPNTVLMAYSDLVYGYSIKLSEITEEQASLLVNCTWKANEVAKYKTAKESLFDLLRANEVKCKVIERKPDAMLIYTMQRFECTADEIWRCREYNELPEDCILFIKNI